MLPDQVLNPGPLTYESGTLPIALRGPARKRGITQPKIYGIGSKFNQFIYTLVCTYIPNIRILVKAVLQIFCSEVIPLQNVRKRGITQPKIYGIGSKLISSSTSWSETICQISGS